MFTRSFFTAVVIVTGYLVATTKSIGSNPVAFTTVATSTVSSAVSHAQQNNAAKNHQTELSVTMTTTAPKSNGIALATTPTTIANSESPNPSPNQAESTVPTTVSVAPSTAASSTVTSAVSHAQQDTTAKNNPTELNVVTTTTAPKSIGTAYATTSTLRPIANSESSKTTNVIVTTPSRPATDKSSSGTENNSGTKTNPLTFVTTGDNHQSLSLGASEPTAPSPAASGCPPNGTNNDPKCRTTSTIPSTSKDNRTGTTSASTNVTLLSETRGRPTTPIVKNLHHKQLTDYEHAVIGLAVTLAVIMIAAVGMVIHKCRRSNMYGVLYPEEGSKSLRGQYARFYDDTIL